MKPTALVPVYGTHPYFQIDLIISLDDGNTAGSQNIVNSNLNVQYMFPFQPVLIPSLLIMMV
jgi:hypothetical protein